MDLNVAQKLLLRLGMPPAFLFRHLLSRPNAKFTKRGPGRKHQQGRKP